MAVDPRRYTPDVVEGALEAALGWVKRGVNFPTVDLVLAGEVVALRKRLEQAQALVPRWRAMAEAQRACAARWREAGAAFDAHAERCVAHAEILETMAVILAHVVRADDDEAKSVLADW